MGFPTRRNVLDLLKTGVQRNGRSSLLRKGYIAAKKSWCLQRDDRALFLRPEKRYLARRSRRHSLAMGSDVTDEGSLTGVKVWCIKVDSILVWLNSNGKARISNLFPGVRFFL